jgi:hypothetical protein
MKNKVYIVGAISGDKNWKEKFKKAAGVFNSTNLIIMTPLDYPEGLTQKEYMQLSVQNVFLADWLYVIPGWENSKGTKAEIALAKSIRVKIEYGNN